ncbi:hypothetical protein [Bacillus smithii]|uniref:hypothetical protein n=1 Tax=Bacillus smithii TaxID=1479 RepID=UPI003D1C0AEF
MKTEKRKAKVGERIVIRNAYITCGKYKNGDILTVEESFPVTPGGSFGYVYVREIDAYILDQEYEVIVDETEADKVENVNFSGMSLAELEEFVQKAVKELSKRAFHAGFRGGREAQRKSDGKRDERKKSLQQRRDEIIEKAKRDVEKLLDRSHLVACDVKMLDCVNFYVNKEKRTVVAIVKYVVSKKVKSRGIAKCAPDDCFNVHIGKAIALRRALGLAVPDEYLNAPQPTEVKVGDIIQLRNGSTRKVLSVDKKYMYYGNGKFNSLKLISDGRAKIIDDSCE